MFVDDTYHKDEADLLPPEIWQAKKSIKAVDVSKDKTMAAVAMEYGTISLVSLPTLLEEWQYETKYEISSVTFAPDDSFFLFGKIETDLDIAKKEEVTFFPTSTDLVHFFRMARG